MCPNSYGVTPNKLETDIGSKLSRDISRSDRGNASAILPSKEILALSQHKKSGLILCKRFHSEFIGPGAAVGTPQAEGYKAVITICSPKLVEIDTYQERQRAYKTRIQWMRWQQQITKCSNDPIACVERLLSCFEAFFGLEAIAQLPSQAIARLIGVFPETVERFRQDRNLIADNGGSAVTCWETLCLDAANVTAVANYAIAPVRQANFLCLSASSYV